MKPLRILVLVFLCLVMVPVFSVACASMLMVSGIAHLISKTYGGHAA